MVCGPTWAFSSSDFSSFSRCSTLATQSPVSDRLVRLSIKLSRDTLTWRTKEGTDTEKRPKRKGYPFIHTVIFFGVASEHFKSDNVTTDYLKSKTRADTARIWRFQAGGMLGRLGDRQMYRYTSLKSCSKWRSCRHCSSFRWCLHQNCSKAFSVSSSWARSLKHTTSWHMYWELIQDYMAII